MKQLTFNEPVGMLLDRYMNRLDNMPKDQRLYVKKYKSRLKRKLYQQLSMY